MQRDLGVEGGAGFVVLSHGPYALSRVAVGGGPGGQAVPGPPWAPRLPWLEGDASRDSSARPSPSPGPASVRAPTPLPRPKLEAPPQQASHRGSPAGGRKAVGGGEGGGRRRAGRGPSPRAAGDIAPPGQGAEKTATGEEEAAAEAGFGVSLRSGGGGGGGPSASGEAAA